MEFDWIVEHAHGQRRYEQYVCTPFFAIPFAFSLCVAQSNRIPLDSCCIVVQDDSKEAQGKRVVEVTML